MRQLRRVFTATLAERKQVAQNTVEVSFQRPEGFTFEAGQYIQVGLPKLLHRDRKGRSRVFSIASSPQDDTQVSIAYRETGSGFKQTMRDLDIGAEVQIEGPHGFYTLPHDPSRSVNLVAGGIGITPFMSMVRATRSSDHPSPRMALLYVNWSPKTAAYLDELKDSERGDPRLTVGTHFGVIDEAFIRTHVKNLHRTWYIAGPPIMGDAVRSALHVLGVDADQVHFEEFIGY